MARDPKPRVLILDAAEPADGVPDDLPWDQAARYLDKRRSYLFRMADTVIIRDSANGRERWVKVAGRNPCIYFAGPIQEDIVDTMAACGFGFA